MISAPWLLFCKCGANVMTTTDPYMRGRSLPDCKTCPPRPEPAVRPGPKPGTYSIEAWCDTGQHRLLHGIDRVRINRIDADGNAESVYWGWGPA